MIYSKYEKEITKMNLLISEVEKNKVRAIKMKTIINAINEKESFINEYDKSLFGLMVKSVRVIDKNIFEFHLKDNKIYVIDLND